MLANEYSHSPFTFQLLRMILDEQHDLQKAKESVYILQRGLSKTLILLTFRTKGVGRGGEGGWYLGAAESIGYTPKNVAIWQLEPN